MSPCWKNPPKPVWLIGLIWPKPFWNQPERPANQLRLLFFSDVYLRRVKECSAWQEVALCVVDEVYVTKRLHLSYKPSVGLPVMWKRTDSCKPWTCTTRLCLVRTHIYAHAPTRCGLRSGGHTHSSLRQRRAHTQTWFSNTQINELLRHVQLCTRSPTHICLFLCTHTFCLSKCLCFILLIIYSHMHTNSLRLPDIVGTIFASELKS